MEDLIRKLFNFSAWSVPIIILAVILLPQMVRVLREYERGVIFRLGKLLAAKGPGLIILIAVVKVENFWKATSLIAQTTLRSVLGQAPLDDLLAQRDVINQKLQEIIDRQTEPWGVKVTSVEVKDVSLPDSMKRAMAKQAEAERERRAKIVNAEGEFQAAEKMVQAAAMISKEPIALQLRFLQTMREISSEHNTTTFLPVPIDLFGPFLKK